MAEDKRKGWLKELKAGDYVFIKRSGMNEIILIKVKKITPTGKIVTDYATFDSFGLHHHNRFNINMLVEANEKDVAEHIMEKQKKIFSNQIMFILKENYKSIDYELLKEIHSKLKGEKE